MKTLTKKQKEFLECVEVGETLYVATSEYSNSKATGYWNDWKLRSTVATLKGLETRGVIKIDLLFWRGAKVTVLKKPLFYSKTFSV